jgi:pimeloyl-ACP methyl ester carboxylesterase
VNQSPRPGPPAPPERHGNASRGRRWHRVALVAAAAAVLAAGGLAAAWAAGGTAPARSPRAERPTATPGRTPTPRPAAPQSLAVGTIGAYPVAQQELVFVDRSRDSLGPLALPTLVRYPVIPAAAGAATSGRLARGLFPLVVFAPGFAQCQASYAALLRTWASAGYVVAAVNFPRTNCHLASPDESDLVNQPADLAYVIARMLAASRRPGGFLAGLIDPAKIAVAGHSDGGDTVAALAANTCCRDPAVTAAIVLAGAEWPPMGGSWFTRPAPPILFVQGDADDINPPAASVTMYQHDTSGPRFYLDLLGAGHLPPYEDRGPAELVVARVTVDFLDRYLAGSPAAAAAMRHDAHVAGIAAMTSGSQPPP